jgi:hypothetical protein
MKERQQQTNVTDEQCFPAVTTNSFTRESQV